MNFISVRRLISTVVIIVGIFIFLTNPVVAADFYVSSTGTASGNGLFNNPWDIKTALENGGNPAGSINAGDTVYLRGGIYSVGWGINNVYLHVRVKGTSSERIYVKPVSGEKVTIDGKIFFEPESEYITFINNDLSEFEIMNGEWNNTRVFNETDPGYLMDRGGIHIRGKYIDLTNLVIHDTSNAVANQDESIGGNIYGLLLFNNGYQIDGSNPGGHGHGFYYQNQGGDPPRKNIKEVVSLHNFSKAGQVYNGGDFSTVTSKNVTIEGLVSVYDELVYSGIYNEGGIIKDSFLHGSVPGLGIPGSWPFNLSTYVNISVTNNTFWGTKANTYDPFFMNTYQSATFTGNRVIGEGGNRLVTTRQSWTSNLYPYLWNNNTYYAPNAVAAEFRVQQSNNSFSTYNWTTWKNTTGYDVNSTISSGTPQGIEIYVRPNIYERGRANIIIYNWNSSDSVTVDLSTTGIQNGETFELRNVANYFGDTPITGTFSSVNPRVVVDMRQSRWTYARPLFGADGQRGSDDTWGRFAGNPFPRYGVFILRRASSTGSSPQPSLLPSPSLIISPTPLPSTLPTTALINPIADTYVSENVPTQNFGANQTIIVDTIPDPIQNGFLKFDLSPFSSRTLSSARLRLYITNSSVDTQSIYETNTNWDELSLSYATMPLPGINIATIQATNPNAWVDVDLTEYMRSKIGQPVSFMILANTTDGIVFSSREAVQNDPELVLEFVSGYGPGDANGDGMANILDFAVSRLYFGQTVSNGNQSGDFNASGVVDSADIFYWLGRY